MTEMSSKLSMTKSQFVCSSSHFMTSFAVSVGSDAVAAHFVSFIICSNPDKSTA